MFVLANLVLAIAQVLYWALTIYMYIVIARALVSWVNPDPRNPIVRFLYNATEPLLARVRTVVPYMAAIRFRVSPARTVYQSQQPVGGTGCGGGCGAGAPPGMHSRCPT